MAEISRQSDSMNDRFARVMVIVSRIGLIAMVVCGVLWLFNFDPYVNRSIALAHCTDSASLFWKEGAGAKTGGYAWFLTKLKYTDCLTILAVIVLAVAPLISLVATIPRCTRKIYVCFMAVIALELGFAILRPILMRSGLL